MTIPKADKSARQVSLQVLVVDDHEDTRDGYAIFLRANGLAAVTAASGREARQHLSRSHTDVVVLDVTLADMSGLELLAEMKGRSATAGIPVLLVSGHHFQNKPVGAADVLLKPILPAQLLQHVRRVAALPPA
jgi:DNA-binding NtrC family response regulator